MGYAELEAKIKADHEKDLDAVRKRAEAEVASLHAEAGRAASEAASKILVSGKKRGAERMRQIVGQARLESIRKVGEERNRLVGEVFSRALTSILESSDRAKAALLKTLSKDASLIDGKKNILVDKRYKKLVKPVAGAKVVAEDIGDFGVIIESQDRLVRVDNRLKTILEKSKPRLKPQVAKILFG